MVPSRKTNISRPNRTMKKYEFITRCYIQIRFAIKNHQLIVILEFYMVPRGGFEPPTQGFSILCSTPELPRHVSCLGSIEKFANLSNFSLKFMSIYFTSYLQCSNHKSRYNTRKPCFHYQYRAYYE